MIGALEVLQRMAATPASVPNAGCFLCGRPGAVQVGRSTPEGSDAPVFRYYCATCGSYTIHSVLSLEVAEGTKPLEIESAALERWNNTLEAAERQRRVSKRSDEPVRRDSSDKIACA